MPQNDAEFRRRLIDRVDALRAAARMSKEEFTAAAGPVAARSWTRFVAANESDAWHYLSIETLDRIAAAFNVGGADLVRFRSEVEKLRHR
jgi:hypothetical protein